MLSVNSFATYLNDVNARISKVHCDLNEVFILDGQLVIDLYGCDSFDFLIDLPYVSSCSYLIEPRYYDDDFQGYHVKISFSIG